ncbi:MAG: NUDIX domain-containing protein [Phycisphaerales bacterium]|nr:NUDIX domain-containing protein [Phycisphaerales bacterium]
MSDPGSYKVAVLCYLTDAEGRVLLLHRVKSPNAGMYSPVGGKLEMALGEGIHDCAIREIAEETGIRLAREHVRLIGIVSERAYEGRGHWLLFLLESTRSIGHDELAWTAFDEGTLEWIEPERVGEMDIPWTDRHIMWPLVRAHHGGFFVVHIDCSTNPPTWVVHESVKAVGEVDLGTT